MVIQFANVSKTFARHKVLRGLTFNVPEGSAFALFGANGAGKTTTIRLLMNLLTPTTGDATVLGVNSRALSHRELTRIGYVSENQEMPGRMRVGDYIGYLRSYYPTWDRALEAQLLKRLQLPLDRRIRDLSHGMRMKTGLVCSLPYRPSLLVLDEPLSGLDPLVRDEFMDGLLMQAKDTTVLISSHELAEIEAITTDIVFLDRGALLFQSAKADLIGRVRAVRLTLQGEAHVPQGVPPGWLDIEVKGNELSFVDTQYSSEELSEQIRRHFGPVQASEIKPLSLRSIYTTLARSTRVAVQ